MMTKKIKSLAALAFAVWSLNTQAAVDMFLEIEGEIKGESMDRTYKDNIDVLAWSWGASQSGSFHFGAGSGAGRASFQDLAITKWIDSSSTVLYKYIANGDHFDKATLSLRKPGDKPFVFQQLVMYKVMVTSASTGGSGGEDRLTEYITLNFESFCIGYTKQNSEGAPAEKYNLCWNVAEASPCSLTQVETLFKLPLVMSLPGHVIRELNPVCTNA
jgi:type VI secretion system secreted protein Hcp